MVSTVGSFNASSYSWSPSHKDYDGDKRVSKDEFMAQIPKGESGLVEVPYADLPPELQRLVPPQQRESLGSMKSLASTFNHLDANHDGFLDKSEIGEVSTSAFVQGKTYLQDLKTYGSPDAVAGAYGAIASDSLAKPKGASTSGVQAAA